MLSDGVIAQLRLATRGRAGFASHRRAIADSVIVCHITKMLAAFMPIPYAIGDTLSVVTQQRAADCLRH